MKFKKILILSLVAVITVETVMVIYTIYPKQKIEETPKIFEQIPSPTIEVIANTPTQIPKITSVPLVDCVGPDGKHARLTKKACEDFNRSWSTPTPTAKPTSLPIVCNTSTDLGNLTITIVPESGQSLFGDASVNMTDGSGNCAGHDSRLPWLQIIRQGSDSMTYSGFRPGVFHVEVNYHGRNYGRDVNLNSGNNSVTISVSN